MVCCTGSRLHPIWRSAAAMSEVSSRPIRSGGLVRAPGVVPNESTGEGAPLRARPRSVLPGLCDRLALSPPVRGAFAGLLLTLCLVWLGAGCGASVPADGWLDQSNFGDSRYLDVTVEKRFGLKWISRPEASRLCAERGGRARDASDGRLACDMKGDRRMYFSYAGGRPETIAIVFYVEAERHLSQCVASREDLERKLTAPDLRMDDGRLVSRWVLRDAEVNHYCDSRTGAVTVQFRAR
jgi:hypothetical protein